MWDATGYYELPTPGHLTSVNGSSSSPGLLKTPTAQLAVNGGSQHPDKRRAGGHGPTLADQVEHQLLPTPTARDGKGANQRGDTTCLHGALLPTPRATDGTKGGPNQRGSSGDLMLPSAVMDLLPTPSVADATGGHKHRSGARSGEPLLGGIAMLLPTGVGMPSPSADGSTSPDAPRHAQPSLDEPASA
jgi:hypothetical protein